jgi:hypothetical protein
MYRVRQADGTLRRDVKIKVLRIAAYFLMALAGVLLLWSPILRDDLGWLGVAMAGFLAVGGVFALSGAVTERWAGEFIGLPLLSSSFAVFGIISTAGSLAQAPLIALANLSLLLAVTSGLLARWREVKAIYRVSDHLSRKVRLHE